jgi:hypothetical protein
MRPVLRSILRHLSLLALALPLPARAQETRAVSGVVVDAATGAPVADVLVSVKDTNLRAATDAQGRFRLAAVPAARSVLVLVHVAYGEHQAAVPPNGSREFTVRISSKAIELTPVEVQVQASDAQARRASGNAVNVLERPQIDASQRNHETAALMLTRVPGIHLNDTCVEYRGTGNNAGIEDTGATAINQPYNGPRCQAPAVYVDGREMPQGPDVLQTLALDDIERVRVLSPSEAGVQYRDSSHGVILIETRRGVAAETEEQSVHLTGFAWNDPQPYPWLRAVGFSALSNAAAVGLAYAAVDCTPADDALRPASALCGTMGNVATAVFSSTLASLVTRWAGGTTYSSGRSVPAALLGGATATVGYLLRTRGQDRGSAASRNAGHVVLGVGVPLVLTLSDRVFRAVR